ncbi:hypothetical protein VTN77DRAFT_4465 [Rasamsonia byssochlamydoides]|uniref:uncharacterized protein n=1 Tax=Rasamsonia byssochlamydoides TaxID=89139 RepID=UPI0037438D58
MMESSSTDHLETFNSASSEPSAMKLSLDPFDKLVEGLDHHPFTSIRSLRKRLEDRRLALETDKTRNHFLVFTNVPEHEVARLDNGSSRASKFARLSYNTVTQILIVKVMPRPEHDIASREFGYCIYDEVSAMNLRNEIDSLGSTTVQIGNWKKQADECWAPSQQATQLSAILEIGLSELAQRLAADARGWLETTGSTIEVAITMKVDRNNPQITIRLWERGPRLSLIVTRQSPTTAHCIDQIEITRTNNTTIVTGDLTLPFRKVVGRVPNNPLENDFLIPRQKLQQVAEKVWRKQGFI